MHTTITLLIAINDWVDFASLVVEAHLAIRVEGLLVALGQQTLHLE